MIFFSESIATLVAVLAITSDECQMCFSGFWSHAIRMPAKQPAHSLLGGRYQIASHLIGPPTSSQFDTSGFEKPVAFGKVSGNPKLHWELRYFHFTGSLSVSCQERFQRLLRVAQAHRWRSLGLANFKKKTRQRLLKRPSSWARYGRVFSEDD